MGLQTRLQVILQMLSAWFSLSDRLLNDVAQRVLHGCVSGGSGALSVGAFVCFMWRPAVLHILLVCVVSGLRVGCRCVSWLLVLAARRASL